MPLTRRALLRASAAAALTAACSPGATRDAASPAGTPTTATATPSGAATSASTGRPVATAGTRRVRTAREVRHGPRTSTAVALTFHGAGDPALATRLLSELERRGVRASVLAVGTWLQADPTMASRIVSAGHDLGNHTLHHYPMRTLGARAAFDEVEGCARVLRRTAGGPGTWFRASGTQATTPTIRRAAARAGYDRCISYDVDGLDWQDPAAETVVRAVLDGARGGSIVSLHLGHRVTVAALPDVLDGLRARHLQPVTLTELLG